MPYRNLMIDHEILNELLKLSTRFQSWDYDTCESVLQKEHENSLSYSLEVWKAFLRWFLMVVIGILTGFFAFVVEILIGFGVQLKFSLLQKGLDKCEGLSCLYNPLLVWIAINVGLVFIASSLVTLVEPVAAGSGIPQLKCYLNGLKYPGLFRLKTFLVKTIAVICSVLGDLAVGKEPAVTNAGGFFAAGISQGKAPSLNVDCRLFKYFRSDREKRDFVTGGAAVGVGAAFSAPIAGVMFSLEEGASFWNHAMTWRMLLGSMTSVLTLNVCKSWYEDKKGNLSYPGIADFGKIEENVNYNIVEISIFILMGAIGGLSGALYNHLFYKLALLRVKLFRGRRLIKVLEVCIVGAVTAVAGLLMLYYANDCKPVDENTPDQHIRMFCASNEYTTIGSFWFQSPEGKVTSMFHQHRESHRQSPAVIYKSVVEL